MFFFQNNSILCILIQLYALILTSILMSFWVLRFFKWGIMDHNFWWKFEIFKIFILSINNDATRFVGPTTHLKSQSVAGGVAKTV